jgi:hypothetical protein
VKTNPLRRKTSTHHPGGFFHGAMVSRCSGSRVFLSDHTVMALPRQHPKFTFRQARHVLAKAMEMTVF